MMPSGNPPEHHHRDGELLEPLLAAADVGRVRAFVDILEERVNALPDGHIDDQERVVVDVNIGGVVVVALEPPDEAGG